MRAVGIAQLKAHLSKYLRGVRRGYPLTVLDRGTPIARIVPYVTDAAPPTIRRPLPGSPGLHRVLLPPPLKTDVDVLDLLFKERQGER